ncbi:DUF5763 domain-containing protein [Sphingobacterium haloxyli]
MRTSNGAPARILESTSVRCRGITKAGARCKRKTKNVNGYCFQHEPSQ